MKIYVTERKELHTPFDGDIKDLISNLHKLLDEGWVKIEVEYHYEDTSYFLCRERLETDVELELRLAKEKKKEETRLKNKQKRFERFIELKKEFDNA